MAGTLISSWRACAKISEAVEWSGDVDGVDLGVHQSAVAVVCEEDDKAEVGVELAVGGAQEGETGGVDQGVGAIAAVGAMGLRPRLIAGCGLVFGLVRGGHGDDADPG